MMQSSELTKAHIKGFTLVELAVVLVIIGLTLTMFLGPLTAQREIRARAETTKILAQSKQALMGYTVINGYLPCPDVSVPLDGNESRNGDGSCVSSGGVIPWKTLGISGVDAWDRYLRYHVDATFSRKTPRFSIADADNSTNIQISDGNGVNLMSAKGRPVVVVLSHGATGLGAVSANGVVMPAPAGVDELENADNDVNFVSHAPTPADAANAFDDMLVWISPTVLINHMIVSEQLP